jgi:integrase
MAKIELPYVAWRQGRPRFVPGERERALGYKGQDLKHDDGRWFSLDEAHGFAIARRDEIRALRKTGKKLKAPPAPKGRAVKDLWHAYANSDEFKGNPAKQIKGLAPSSQKSYRDWIKPLKDEPLWDAPVASLDPIVLKGLHGTILAKRTLAMANYCISALSAALSWGRLRGWLPKIHGQVPNNPASRLDLPPLPVRIRIATDAEIRALVEASDRVELDGAPLSAIGDAVLTGLFSGQRKKDVLEFVPGHNSNTRVELLQSKTGARDSIPMAPRLVERLAEGRSRRAKRGYKVVSNNIVINEGTGLPYHGVTFRDHFRMVRADAIKTCASLVDFTFPDLRDTAVTWYARAGATVPEIASITGHSLASIYQVLKHYLALDAEMADNAVQKLVDWMEREGLAV